MGIKTDRKNNKTIFLVLILASVILRIFLTLFFISSLDTGAYDNWLEAISYAGFFNMYNADKLSYIVDYPPIFPALLTVISKFINSIFQESQITLNLIYKTFPVLFDFGIIAFLYRKHGALTSTLWAINPAAIVISSMWAQSDSLFIMAMFLFFAMIINKKAIPTGIFYALMCLIKPQGIYLFPVYMIFLIYEKFPIKKKILSFVIGLSTGILGWLPFMINYLGILLPFKVYFYSSNLFNFYSMNAANIWFFNIGYEFAPSLNYVNYAILIAMVAALILIFFFTRDYILSSAIYMFGIFMFTLNQHDRYPIYTIALMIIFYGLYKNRNILIGIVINSITLGAYLLVILLLRDDYITNENLTFMLYTLTQLAQVLTNVIVFLLLLVTAFRARKEAKA